MLMLWSMAPTEHAADSHEMNNLEQLANYASEYSSRLLYIFPAEKDLMEQRSTIPNTALSEFLTHRI